MDVNEIKTLLDKFYEGQTSDAEEKILRDAAHEGTLPGDDGENVFLESLYAGVEIPEGLEERLGKQIDSWNSVEKNVMRNTRTATLKWIGGVAAAILLLFTVGMVLNDRQDGQQY